MTEVDFYILKDASADAALRAACRIAQKACSQGLRIYIYLDSDDEASRMDDLLWTFQQDSFVPHERWHGVNEASAQPDGLRQPGRKANPVAQSVAISATSTTPKVLIGTTAQPPGSPQLLINLGAQVAECFAQCPRVVEIVAADPVNKSAGRERYRAYREQGVPLRMHEV